MKKVLIKVRNLIFFLFLFSVLQVLLFKFIPVYFTPLMIVRSLEQKISGEDVIWIHNWKSIDSISPYLAQAVVASEDNLFYEHSGFDFKQIEKAIEEAERGRRKRGASTISQQTAKNVFLWPGKSYIRKGFEAYYTILIEFVWGKDRIMEVYLNSIEMGNGIYGAEAVSQLHFEKNAFRLSRQDAALIVASLPNPRKFNSSNPTYYMLKRQKQILSLMDKIGVRSRD